MFYTRSCYCCRSQQWLKIAFPVQYFYAFLTSFAIVCISRKWPFSEPDVLDTFTNDTVPNMVRFGAQWKIPITAGTQEAFSSSMTNTQPQTRVCYTEPLQPPQQLTLHRQNQSNNSGHCTEWYLFLCIHYKHLYFISPTTPHLFSQEYLYSDSNTANDITGRPHSTEL